MATAREAARSLCVTDSPVTLIYIGDGDDLLRRRVREVARRHPAVVELLELARGAAPVELSSCGGASVLLVMRQGELFVQAVGALPATELERVIARAMRRARSSTAGE